MMHIGIQMRYESDINAMVIRMPELITLAALQEWRKNFLSALDTKIIPPKVSLLIDTNTHHFESVQCLKLLRHLLSNEINYRLSAVAFVQPEKYRRPEIAGAGEGYFDNFADAHSWLQKNHGVNSAAGGAPLSQAH